jgi:hypothetical protein
LISVKEIIISVLEKGEQSAELNNFVNLCIKYSKGYCLIKYKNQKYILEKIIRENGLDTGDFNNNLTNLAKHCIAELFEQSDDEKIFTKLDSSFKSKSFDVYKAEEEQAVSKLRSIVCNKTKQCIFDNNNNIYKHTRNALNLCLKRNTEFKQITHKDGLYLYICEEEELDFSCKHLEQEEALNMLLIAGIIKPTNPKIIMELLSFLNSQSGILKAVEFDFLVRCVTEYYEKRMSEERDIEEANELNMNPIEYQERFNENFRKTIKDNKKIKNVLHDEKEYIHTCKQQELDFRKDNQCPKAFITGILFGCTGGDLTVIVVLCTIFEELNGQKELNGQFEYNKAILYLMMRKTLFEFYNIFLQK